jgi:hypothetical protein
MIVLFFIILFACNILCQKVPDIPDRFIIQNVPYHHQITGYACGDASFQMVMHKWGSNINQYSIMDVVRTSDHEGTLSYDLIRGGHFSSLSSTPSQYKVLFPEYAPKQGWRSSNRQYGYAAFGYRNDSDCYIQDVVRVISHDIPVITLMKLNLQGGGHYRVAIGYEWDGKGYTITLLDPWDKKNNSRIVQYDQDLFCNMWNHREPVKFPSNINFDKPQPMPNDVDSFPAHFAAIIYPWKVSLCYNFDANYKISEQNGSNIIVTANVTYDCFKPFCNIGYGPIARDTYAIIQFHNVPGYVTQGEQKILIGNFKPGDNVQVSWNVFVKDNNIDKADIPLGKISVQVVGEITASVPENWYDKENVSPSYTYTDFIGGEASIHY